MVGTGSVAGGFFVFFGWSIFLGAIMLAVVLGSVLAYHWIQYARNQQATTIAILVYGAGCITILAMLLGAVLSLS